MRPMGAEYALCRSGEENLVRLSAVTLRDEFDRARPELVSCRVTR